MIDHLKFWFVRHLTVPLECKVSCIANQRESRQASTTGWEKKPRNACLILGEEVQFLCFIEEEKNVFHIFRLFKRPKRKTHQTLK